MNENYKYRAFISYRHVDRDREWAKWLMERLETYRAPRALVRNGVPLRVGRLFRDDDEIPASSDLGWQLKDALEDSEYLIVVCSPDTPASAWVRREITIFQELGRGNRIIPLLVAGTPEESFPPELLRPKGSDSEVIEPLAADVRVRSDEDHEDTKRRAWLRIAATLLRCRYDDLENREQRRASRKHRSLYIAAGCALAIVAAGLAYWWDHTRIKTKYYEEYVTEYGVPRGIRPLSETQAKGLNSTIAIREQRGQIVRMSRLQGASKPRETKEWVGVDPWIVGIAEWHYEYDAQGMLSRVGLYNGQGRKKLMESYHFSPDRRRATVTFETEGEQGEIRAAEWVTANSQLGLADGRAEITQNDILFDEAGRITERRFRTYRGDRAIDGDGASGRRYRIAQDGLIAAIEFLDQENQPMSLRTGIARIDMERNSGGRIVRASLRGIDGAPALSAKKYTTVEFVYDERGNIVTVVAIGLDGKSTLDSSGVARWQSEYDDRGNEIRSSYFDTTGQPTLHKDGFASFTTKFDARANEVEIAVFGVDGKPVLDKSGCWKMTWEFDGQNRPVTSACHDTNEKVALDKSGFARTRTAYNSRGDSISVDYLDPANRPILNNEGYARVTWAYDSRGNASEVAYFGVDGRPIARDTGYSRVAYVYDSRGQLTQIDYFGTDGSPVLTGDGFARKTSTYDTRGQEVEVGFFGLDGKSKNRKGGYARTTKVYDEHGQFIELAYFGEDGAPVLVEGSWKQKRSYDSRGYSTTQEFFGIDGRPILNADGVHRIVSVPDAQGRPTRISLFGVDGAPIYSAAQQSSSHTWKYDDRGNVTEIAVYGVDGKPSLFSGFWRIEQTYDARNNQTSQSVFGADGKPALYKNSYSRVEIRYDDHDRPRQWDYFGVDGKPTLTQTGCARRVSAYDARGKVIEESCFGVDGGPLVNAYGYARARYAYDPRGRQVEAQFLSVDGKPVLTRYGHARWVDMFDENGTSKTRTYYDADGRAMKQLNR